jgi:NADPH-dependent 2,4-dienoyl-CoA reductase/sulfur reductase-like enzyme
VNQRRLVIVGAGPAGLAAAVAAAEAGVELLLVDEQPRIGGQIYRQPPSSLPPKSYPQQSSATRRGADLFRRFHSQRDRIELLTETNVWGLFPHRRLAVTRNGGWDLFEAEQLILAPGAHEYVPPFPGWTLPGVMTPGCGQLLTKTMQACPGKRVLVAGSGPFLLVVAEQLHRAGLEVVGVAEAASRTAALRAMASLLLHPGQLWEGLGYLSRLARAGIPVYRGQIVVEARGNGQLRQVILAPCNRDWLPDCARARTLEVDTLCIGYGFVPRSQLAQMAGCKMQFMEQQGGWIPIVDENGQTTVPGVWVAGDGGGVAGALVAQEEGGLAGLAAARQLGVLSSGSFARVRRPILRRLRQLRRFRAVLDEMHQLRSGLCTLARPDTVVCRCEELKQEEIESGLNFGGEDLRTIKVMTRLGMGPCQGCMCWPAAARWIAARLDKPIAAIGPLSVRPPLGSLNLGDLISEAGLIERQAAVLAEEALS